MYYYYIKTNLETLNHIASVLHSYFKGSKTGSEISERKDEYIINLL